MGQLVQASTCLERHLEDKISKSSPKLKYSSLIKSYMHEPCFK